MTMDIGHLRGFLSSVVKTSVLTAYLHHALASGISLWNVWSPSSKRRKKASSLLIKKANTEESEFVDG